MLTPVILSGGNGSRLWPLSRERHPKQLLPLCGEESMLQATALRLQGMAGGVSPPIVVSNEEYRFITAEQLRAIGVAARLVLEPVGRNTAPALTLAALLAQRSGGDPVLLVMPADHVLQDRAAFQCAVAAALPEARAGAIVTFGIVPERAETAYGYLELGAAAEPGLHALEGFVEKPDAPTAARYVAGGRHLWNSGMFLLRAGVWLEALRHFNPAMLEACTAALAAAREDADFIRADRAALELCPADSIDYAVMEKLAADPGLGIPARVVPLEAGWSDVGAWDALWQVSGKDDAGNAACGDVLLFAARNNLVRAEARLVACVGVEDLVVVETADAVLVMRRQCAQDVKQVVARLKAGRRAHALEHRKVHRPWGWYDATDNGERFQVKRIMVKPGASLSLQMHYHRAEHWVVVRGTARVTRGEETLLVTENQSTYIPVGVAHRLENPGKVPLELIEVQSGAYLGEDDIVRFGDAYGRT
jgi:mannose-1-phosphate guanylyltransferase/mannose-6-phosphate isomerase